MTVAVFEELRFVWELLAAEFVLLMPFAQRKANFPLRVLLSWLAMTALSQGYFLVLVLEPVLRGELFAFVVGSWYIFLILLSMGFFCWCFRLTLTDALYICVSGYSEQHIVYVLVHELLALYLWPELPENLLLYALISLGCCVVIMAPIHFLFSRWLRVSGGKLYRDNITTVAVYAMQLVWLICCTFTCQHLFRNVDGVQMIAAQLGVAVCAMMLFLQHTILKAVHIRQERTVIAQTLQNSARQYALSKEMVDHINRTCHDLKHNLQVLKTIDEGQRRAYIEEAEGNIAKYHELVHCEDEVLNTILGEKCLFCSHRGVRLSCTVDGGDLSFVATPDLYAILGNAIENAFECVERFDDPEKRVISLTISSHGAFTSIQTNNYCEDRITVLDGLPVTTKGIPGQRGFGLKSIRFLVEKYGGSIAVDLRDRVFTLQIMLPQV